MRTHARPRGTAGWAVGHKWTATGLRRGIAIVAVTGASVIALDESIRLINRVQQAGATYKPHSGRSKEGEQVHEGR